MGQKGTGVNVTGVSATFITLTKLIGHVDEDCGIIQTARLHIMDEISDSSVDAETKGNVERILTNITDTMHGVQEQSAAIKKQVNKLLEVANEIQSRARAASTATEGKTAGVKQKFAKR